MILMPELESASCKFMCGVVEGFYGRPWTSEQRKRLFQRMHTMGMDTYLYAPKDDCKHRMFWRDLYTVEEADHLTTLIEAAEEENVTFVYALSPGLDVTYSSAKEVTCLKRKLEQVASFGCKAYALLFDDIDVDMCEADKEIFQSFAQAQVSITNEVYQHLSQPEKFLFCPTEYCASRAVPNVANSEYLKTIGAKLLSGVDIMWTGPKVVSKKITIKSIEELARVLQRPPVIWDNIHANDYDQRRLFLGPYEGRSSELIPYLRGVLTNPNCEFEANFIAMHTLAQWSKSNASGVKKDFILSESPVTADIKLETEGEYTTDEDVPVHSLCSYQPKLALNEAVKDWLDVFYNECSADPRKLTLVAPPVNMPVMSSSTGVETCSTMTNMTSALHKDLNSELNDSYLQPSTINPVNSLVDPSSESEEESGIESLPEPMDCAASTSGASTCSSGLSSDCTDCIGKVTPVVSSSPTLSTGSDHCQCTTHLDPLDSDMGPVETMQVDSEASPSEFQNIPNPAETSTMPNSILPPYSPTCLDTGLSTPITLPNMCSQLETDCRLTENDLLDFVDLFYMPFDHGPRSVNILNDFHWLKSSVICLCNSKGKDATPEQKSAAEEWREKAEEFCKKLEHFTLMFTKFGSIPNKALLYDLFPYIWDMMVVMNQLSTFVSWLALGLVPASAATILQGCAYSWSSLNFRHHFSSGDQEPWVFRGGLQAEFQRMLPLEGAADLLLMASPPLPVIALHKIRPYKLSDEAGVYEICRRTCDDGVDGTEIFPDQPDLIGDKLVGGYLNTTPDHCFVIEDEKGICGYILAAPDACDFHKKMEMAWLPAMREKYPKPSKDDDLTPAEEIISSFYNNRPSLSGSLLSRHPAIVRMDILPDRLDDPTSAKRAMASVVAALKIGNIHGIHAEIHVGDHNTAELYTKLGFIDIPLPDVPDDMVFMGRMI